MAAPIMARLLIPRLSGGILVPESGPAVGDGGRRSQAISVDVNIW